MDPVQGQGAFELFQAQSHVYKHIFYFANSMSLACALELGIPDIIHNHNQPITPQELVSSLKLPTNKTDHLRRLMSLLVHSKFFSTTKFNDHGKEKEGYILTAASKLLLKNEVPSLLPFVQAMTNPVLLTPWQFLGKWFQGKESTVFETAHGIPMWECADRNPEFNRVFNGAMASDSQMMTLVVNDTKEIFQGVESLVDVGGGTGNIVKIILEAFPHMICTVFDLPHVVADLPESGNLKFVGGDMFQSIPSADAILFKCVMHNWSDEDCVKILKRCREAIPTKDGKGGKVIILDMVIDNKKDEHDITETKLVSDILMMVLVGGRERNEKEWEKLFLEAGFSHYKITPIFGLRSLIEVFP